MRPDRQVWGPTNQPTNQPAVQPEWSWLRSKRKLAATQKNDVIKKRYIKLLASGMPKKLALVACMRKLLTILNDMVRHETKWGEKKKSVAGSVVSNRPAPAYVLDKS